MTEANKAATQELEKIKKSLEKKHPHMKLPNGEVIDKTIVSGEMKKIERAQSQTAEEDIMKPKSSIFEPSPVAVRLPSGKLVIDPKFLTQNNEIYVRRMTAIEENVILKLAGVNDPSMVNKSIDVILENCIKTNIDSKSLLLIDKFALFLKIISITYGPVSAPQVCPSCSSSYKDFKVDVYNDFEKVYVPEGYVYPHPIKIESYGGCDLTWYVTYPTIGDTQEILSASGSEEDIPQLYVTNRIEGWIQEEDGSKRDVQRSDYRPLITNLDKNDRKKYKKFMDEFSGFGIKMVGYFPFCHNQKCSLFEVGQEVSIPIEQIFTTIMSQYTNIERE